MVYVVAIRQNTVCPQIFVHHWCQFTGECCEILLYCFRSLKFNLSELVKYLICEITIHSYQMRANTKTYMFFFRKWLNENSCHRSQCLLFWYLATTVIWRRNRSYVNKVITVTHPLCYFSKHKNRLAPRLDKYAVIKIMLSRLFVLFYFKICL